MARVVVITGGGTGIGAACARLMCAAGDRVFITGRREAPLQAVADETGATALMGDAADGEVWRQRLLPAILDQSGGVDVLILIGLMRSVARDYGPQGVRANAVCPGWVTTPMADEEMLPLMQAEGLSLTEAYQRVCRDVPLRRPASPEEIAEACQFLCSPQAAIISGATLVADGGASIVDVPTLAFA